MLLSMVSIVKRFDFAADVSKQLVTICAAIITVVITFYDKFLSHREPVFTAVMITLALFIVSIACGIAALGGLVNLVETQETPPPLPAPAAIPPATPFVRLGGTAAMTYTQWQQLTFAAALIAFLLVAAVDHYFPGAPIPATAPTSAATPSAPVKP
jgi:hypothetical protein